MPIFTRKRDDEYAKAARLVADGRPREAVEILKTILSEQPTHFNAMVTLAVALLDSQQTPMPNHPDTEMALRMLDQAALLRPKDSIPHFNKGVCLRKVGRREEALRSFQRALELDNKSALTLLHIAEINYELQRWEEAIKYARKAIVRDPALVSALTWVTEVMRRRQEGADRTDGQEAEHNVISAPKTSVESR